MNLLSLALLLEQKGQGRRGKSIFVGMMPSSAEQAILLRAPLVGTQIDYELPGYFRAEFQLIVRGLGGDYAATETWIKDAVKTLTLFDTQLGSTHFNYCRAQTLPVSFPLSEGNLVEFSVRFEASLVEL